MKANYIHVCFVIDESGSMSSTAKDVVEGFKKVIDEQKSMTDGTCSISLYKFNDEVQEVYIGKDINDVQPLTTKPFDLGNLFKKSPKAPNIAKKSTDVTLMSPDDDMIENLSNYSEASYDPHGCTAMYDGIGTAIDNIGVWLNSMQEDEKPSQNLIVIMTDGIENASYKYTAEMVQERIKHQTEKYSWSFIYMGTDITTREYADSLGIKIQSYSSRDKHMNNYEVVNNATSMYRSTKGLSSEAALNMMNDYLADEAKSSTNAYMKEVGTF